MNNLFSEPKKTFIAIDPGASGGIAVNLPDGTVELHKMPDTEGSIKDVLNEIAERVQVDTVWIEQVGGAVSGKKNSPSSMFTFGRNYGFLLGYCSGVGLRVELVTPQKWQKELSIPARGSAKPEEHKRKLKAEAQRRYPRLKITLATCDALLILDWAQLKGVK